MKPNMIDTISIDRSSDTEKKPRNLHVQVLSLENRKSKGSDQQQANGNILNHLLTESSPANSKRSIKLNQEPKEIEGKLGQVFDFKIPEE